MGQNGHSVDSVGLNTYSLLLFLFENETDEEKLCFAFYHFYMKEPDNLQVDHQKFQTNKKQKGVCC